MKATKLTYLLVIALALTMVGTGCRKRVVGITDIKKGQARVGDNTGGETGIRLPGDQSSVIGGPNEPGGGIQSTTFSNPENFNQDRAQFAANTVHFEYDSSVVKSGEHANLEAVAAFMSSGANSGVGLLVEGHCDERGTEDYNNSLGERRATALREALIGMGVNPEHVVTRSFGEYKPVAAGHDESSFRKNRRGEFVVLHPK